MNWARGKDPSPSPSLLQLLAWATSGEGALEGREEALGEAKLESGPGRVEGSMNCCAFCTRLLRNMVRSVFVLVVVVVVLLLLGL